MDNKHLSNAGNSLAFLVSFFLTLGYDPKAGKKLGQWVNEIKRDEAFTFQVERIISFLEDLQSEVITEAKAIESELLDEDNVALLEQVELLEMETTLFKRAATKRVKKGATHEKCSCCSSRHCGWDGRPMHMHNHPPKAHKSRK